MINAVYFDTTTGEIVRISTFEDDALLADIEALIPDDCDWIDAAATLEDYVADPAGTKVVTPRPSLYDDDLVLLSEDGSDSVSFSLPDGTVVSPEDGERWTVSGSETFEFSAPGIGEWVYFFDPPMPYLPLALTIRASHRLIQSTEIESIDGDQIVGDIPIVSDLADDLADEAATRAEETAALAEQDAANAIALADSGRALLDRVKGIEDYVVETMFEGYQQKEQLRTELVATQNTDRASFTSQISAAVSANAAAVTRIDTLEADTATLEASVTAVQAAYVAGDEALSLQIVGLTAGTTNQFDHTHIWHFNTGIEDWTGNGTPTQTAGSLRPANEASDPYVISPDALGVDGAAYTQVRMRVKKVGTPTWQGYHYWKAAADTTWDAGRRDSFSEPSYDGAGYGLITVNSAWTGTIKQIRIDLSSVQDGSNYFLIDWIAIGRPSPGASSAELASEQQARIDADSANASDIIALEARMTDAEDGIEGVQDAVSTLEGSVSTLGGTVSLQGLALTAVEGSLGDKADAGAVDLIQTQIDDFGGADGISSLSNSVRALRNEVDPVADNTIENAFAAYLRDQEVRSALTTATQTLTSRVDVTDTSVAAVAASVTALGAVVDGKASSTALSSLDTRVGIAEGTISSQGLAITGLTSTVAGKADASALSSLSTDVSEIDGEVTSIANALTDLFAGDEDGNIASARVQFTAVGGPTGWARYAVSVRSGSGETFVDAGFYMDVNISTDVSRIVMKADQVIITDDAGELTDAVFRVEGGKVYLNGTLVLGDNIVEGGVLPANLSPEVLSVSNNYYNSTQTVTGGSRNTLAEVTMTFEPSDADIVYRRFTLTGIVCSTTSTLTDIGNLFINIDEGSGWIFPVGSYINHSPIRPLQANLTASCQALYLIDMPGDQTEITFGLELALPPGESGSLKNANLIVVHHATAESA